MRGRGLVGLLLMAAALSLPLSGGATNTFIPDWTFKGSTLTGWHVLGDASWRAVDGELIGTPKTSAGGWLVLDTSLQDVEFGAGFKCTGGCITGVLLRAEKTPTGMKGVYVALTGGDVAGYAVALDANGKELKRDRLRAGGGMVRFAPSAEATAAAAAARGGGGAAAGLGRGRGPLASGAVLPIERPSTALKANDWNDLDIVLDANMLRPIVNTALSGGGAADDDVGKFGPVAIYIGGAGEVRLKDVAYRDLGLKRTAKEQLSPNFRLQRLNPYYYAFSAAAADVERDGNLDVISGPFI